MGANDSFGQEAHLAVRATTRRVAAGAMLALGIDPGSKKNCGWAIVEAVPDADLAVCLASGIVVAHGGEIACRMSREFLHLGPPDVVAWERPAGKFYTATVALNRVVGRWLAMVESLWPTSPSFVEVEASRWQSMYVGKLSTPRSVVDPQTGETRPLLDVEKRAAKQSREDAYRIHAERLLGVAKGQHSDAAAAAWVARYAIDHVPECKAKR